MMIKKNFLILFIIFLTGCSYKPIFSSKNSSFSIKNIEFLSDSPINSKIENNLKIYKNTKNENKTYDLKINVNETKSIALKDLEGNPKILILSLTLEVNSIKNGSDKKIKKLEQSFTYKNTSNKFDLNNYEKTIKNNMINKITENLIIHLQSL